MIVTKVLLLCGARGCSKTATGHVTQPHVTGHYAVAAEQRMRLPAGWWLNDGVDGDPLRCPKHPRHA